ncbi:MAG: hypothetical protein ACK5Q5_01495 [Planctomycetaceae bacterium]
MTSDWQTIVVAIAVLWAAVMVFRRLLRLVTQPSGGCGSAGGCGACPAGSAAKTDLVSLSLDPTMSGPSSREPRH